MFRKAAHAAADALGSSWAFGLALLVVVVWGAAGPFFAYSDSWQLLINTGTTVVTFLVVFLIQNAQNRDARAIHLKLDELIRGVQGARNTLINLQELTDDQLEQLQKDFQRIKRSGAHLSEVAPKAPMDDAPGVLPGTM
jgi:low affinity Fe/Cu permease